MNLSVGIVGLPNAGKSTLFNALLKKQVAFAANYPFATIEPNVGVVPVPDERLPVIAQIVHTEKIVPATVKFVDIAGLVKGASKGEGLGNKFLSHIREVDLICHVVREFKDADVVHVVGDVDAKRDKEIVETELILADLETLEKQVEPRGKMEKEVKRRWELVQQFKIALAQGKNAASVSLTGEDEKLVRDLHILTRKNSIYIINVSENDLAGRMKETENEKNQVIISAKIEAELAGLTEPEQKAYLKELGLEKSGLERLIQKAYEQLGLISFLTGGELEARAWTIYRGTKAPQAAGVIHTDFEKAFIKAEVISYEDFVEFGGWTKSRELGKVRLEGKEYEMQDGDVVDFKVGV
jgi:ribosome-binding ATPase